MLGIKKFDRTEKILFWWFIITFVLDILSTAFFALKGYADLEANVIIWKLGWLIGAPIIIILNLLVLFWFIKALQKTRDHKPGRRYGWVVSITIILSLRTYVVINNFLMPLIAPPTEVVKPTGAELSQMWLVAVVFLLIFWGVSRLSFWIYNKSHTIKYGVTKIEKNK